ncbi:MAG: SRPBCC domain-containing protein [Balneolales bacterium]
MITISDESVRKATGRTWSQWETILDGYEAEKLAHKELVVLLETHEGVVSGWWRQSVAVAYEKMKGKRITGQTAGTGYQMGVQKTMTLSGEQAWKLITSLAGVRIWLGDVTDPVFQKGARYRLNSGEDGQIRVVNPGRHVRLTYKPATWAKASTIQVRVEPKGDKTVVGFHEERIPGPLEREERRAHFRSALDKLQQLTLMDSHAF